MFSELTAMLAYQVCALLVDDNATNLSILQAYCKKRGYDFRSARDGKEAFHVYVTACEAGLAPTICLLDLQMPVCDGISCASMIRAYEKSENLTRCPIIMGKLLIHLSTGSVRFSCKSSID